MTEKKEIKQKAAMLMVTSGRATTAEAARLLRISRQAFHQQVLVHQPAKFDARLNRRKYLRTTWNELVERLTG